MAKVHKFGPFSLDSAAEILFRGAEPVALGHRAVALLRVLIERAGIPVSKHALINAAWPGLAVEENNLTVQIAALRRVFGEESGGERWIETLPRRGYRYVGPAVATEENGQGILPTTQAKPLLALPDKPSIAVLPFDNLSGDPQQEYFADGLAEEIITSLSKFHWFFVIARNSSFTYKRRAVDVKQVARELGVQYVLEGSVRKAGTQIRIAAQLIDALTGRHIWAERYDQRLEDIFTVQDEVTEAIVGSVAPSFISAEARRVRGKSPESFDVWDYAMRGNWHLSRRSKNDIAEARRMFEAAIKIDPDSTMALSGLAYTLGWAINFHWVDDIEQARRVAHNAARRAVNLDENDAGAHVSLAIASFYMHQLDTAAAACRRALELNPNLAMAEGWLAIVLGWRGDYNEATIHAERATRLSPRDTYSIGSFSHACAEFGAGRYEQALEWAKKAIESTPDFPAAWIYVAQCYGHLGRLKEGRAAVNQVLDLLPHCNLRFIRNTLPSVRRERMERAIEGLRKSGMRE